MTLCRPMAGLSLLAAGLLACGSETTDPGPPVPTSLELNSSSVTLDALGATHQIGASVRDQAGQPIAGVTPTFTSSNVAVATVSASGLITAVGNGSANITVAHASLSARVAVAVAQLVAEVAKVAGDGQTGQVAAQLPTAIQVELRDSRGNPVPGGSLPNTSVTFAAANGGSVNPGQVVAGLDGRASAVWTLGSAAGTQQLTASQQGAGVSVAFSATATAAAADTVILVSGNSQVAPMNTALPESLVVRVQDQYGNPVGGHQVTFAVVAGGGSISPPVVNTAANGRGATRWTLGPTLGTQGAEAQTSPGLPGSPVSFTATGTNLSLISIAPDTIVEGGSAVLSGTGFDGAPGNNGVMIGGASAVVTAASPTSLTVTVPSFDCAPARSVNVQVSVGGGNSNALSHPLKPTNILSLAVGQQQIIRDPAGFCVQFAASAASEAYLIGVQSVSEIPSNLTPTRLISTTGFASPGAPPRLLATTGSGSGTGSPLVSERTLRWARHREAESRIRTLDEAVFREGAGRRAASGMRATGSEGFVPPTVNVGDTLASLRVFNGSSCGGFTSITTVVRAKGQRGIWVEDIGNPTNGYTVADFDSLSQYFDNVIFDTDTSYFGNPGDQDANSRAVVVVSKAVNQLSPSILGFVVSCDFFPRTSAAASNEGEFFYAKAPDPTGTFGSIYSRADAFADAPFLIAHEFTHIIQFARRLPITSAFTSWLMEGQATMAEEVNGFVVTGRTTGQNYGFAVAFNNPPSTPIDWHVGGFTDLAVYYGFESSTTRKAEAPHECTWIGRLTEGNNGPCIPGREVYGVPWSLYRWVSDHFGPTFTGGERGLQKAIIGNAAGGYTNLASTVGVAIDTLLAQWAAALYVDDRVPGAATRLTFPSWNLVNIESGLLATARLQPIALGFTAFDQARNVRAGSSVYYRINGSSRPATAVRARTAGDAVLAEPVTMWIVRLQ